MPRHALLFGLLILPILTAACASTVPPDRLAPSAPVPKSSLKVYDSPQTWLSQTGVIETLTALIATNSDDPLETVVHALATAPRPDGAPASLAPAHFAVQVEACHPFKGPVRGQVQARVCPTGGFLRVVYHWDLRSDPAAGAIRLQAVHAALSSAGYFASDAVQWPIPSHMPHSSVQTVFLPAGSGPVVVIDHEIGSEYFRGIALFWPAVD